MEKTPKAAGVRWQISDLYDGANDPRLAADLETALQRAEQFQARFYGKIAQDDLKRETLLAAIVQLEEIYTITMRPEIYAFWLFSEHRG
jgi:hypothetical protein